MSRAGTSHPTPEKLWESRAEDDLETAQGTSPAAGWGREHLGILGATDPSVGMGSRVVPLIPL